MRRILDGLLWGLGFSFAVVFVLVTYNYTLHEKLEDKHQKQLNEYLYFETDSFIEALGIEVIETSLINDEVVVYSKAKNFNETTLNMGLSLRFSLFDSNGQFVGNCDESFPRINSENEHVYLSTSCANSHLLSKNVGKVEVSVLRHR
ncbi:hypothetical protein [Alishewanella sp. HL-SH05]|uniref:hypothetical protein n=1 Tax=Alishewanella sp. HL-SH05 TaxID=3461145 RepID=UPI00404323B0